MLEYEVYRTLYRISERENGLIMSLEHVKTGWFDMDNVHSNDPNVTDLLYVIEHKSPSGFGIRRKRV